MDDTLIKISNIKFKQVVPPKPTDNHVRSLVTEINKTFYITPNTSNKETNNVHVYQKTKGPITYWKF